ncbi:Ig-like domain-containing protein [Shewanella sp. YLB-07]|uniref:Ig-like domain-containing protein n=1 Tax=Shewanella sp. YLB-07 TaxID=2601268 RepID=UPI00128C2A6B|nr:Ig-like domain-containing protein [Shewanella sp. YLB-07]MPY23698.1 tandem-95 repeat protein [Shewanella sp. YLB-07]
MKLDLIYPWILLLTRWVSRFFSPLFSDRHHFSKLISKLFFREGDKVTHLSGFLVLITCLLVVQQAKAAQQETEDLFAGFPETELIIIDSAVHEPYMLYQALNAKFKQHLGQNNKTKIVFLKPELEPLQQIRNAIKDTSDLSQLSIISHASNGAIFLAGKWIDKGYINQHEAMMSEIGSSLKKGADLKLYGCNLASGVSGKSFVNRVAELTQLDVAASTDTTGGVKQGHNWELEYRVGDIDSRSVFFEALPTSYSSTLNHFRYGTMAVEPIAGESGKVRLKVQIGYTLDHYIMTKLVNSSVGTVNCQMNYLAGFSWGDGQGQANICVQLLSKDSATNDALVEVVSIGSNGYEPGLVHKYQADGDYILSWNSYARSPAMSQNNSYWRAEATTSVVNGEITNASPVTAVSALVYVRDDHPFTMQISGVDQNGDKIRYRWGKKKEFYSGNSNVEVEKPTGMQLSPEGLITWDLAGDLANGDLITYTDNANPSTVTSNRWQAAIVLEDLDINGVVKSKAPLDFVFIISDPDNASPGFNPGPEITATQYIQLHQTTTFTITATDVDENGDPDVPTISVLNPPSTDPAIWSTSIISQDSVTGTSVIEVTFIPSDDMLGKAYVVIFSAKDSNGITSEASVNLVIVNEAPIAQDDSALTQQGQMVIVDVLANDSDPDGDPLTITQFNAPNGTVVLNGDNTISYTPDASFSGLEIISYVISDGIGSVASANILVTVNGNPIAQDDLFTINEDTSSVFDVLANDSEPDGDALNMTLTTPSHGQLSLVNNIVTYTPNAQFYGTDSFSYTISDGIGGSDTANVTVTVVSVNDLPVASNDSAELDEDQSISISVLTNDSDPENDPLSVTTHQSLHGTTSVNSNQSLTYAPALNYFGQDQITYSISDGNGGESTATVAITVRPVNDAPTANDDSAALAEDTSVLLTPLSNDVDVEGDLLSYISVVASSGQVTVNPDMSVLYTPTENYQGSVQINYLISDPSGLQSAAVISISVTEVNDAPKANADTATVDEDATLTYAVLDNDIDIENHPLTVSVAQPSHGQASVEANGSITYVPDPDFNGSDSLIYTIDDGHGGQDSALFNVMVNGVNDAPIAVDDSATLNEDANVTVPVLANDSDIDGDSLTVTVQPAANGVASVTALGLVQYTPNAHFNGADSLTYTISDGNGASASAVLSILVSSVNDHPIAINDAVSLDEDTSVTIQVLENDSDLDKDLLVVTAQSPSHGDVTVGLDGNISYTPVQDFNGIDSLTYSIDDGHGGTAQAQLTITINAINDQPVAVDDYAYVTEDGSVTFSVLSNDSDVDNDGLTVTLDTASHGSTVNHNDGSVSYTPDANFNGSDSVQYSVSDGQGGAAQAVIYLNVTAVNDAPVAEADLISMEEDTSFKFDLLLNDTDVEFALNPASTVLVDQPQHMSASVENGVVTLTPNADFNGSDSLTYRVSDGDGAVSNTVAVTIVVAAVNDAPRPEPDFASVDEDIILDIEVLANDLDIDDSGDSSLDIHSVVIVQAPLHGQLTHVDGVLSYLPDGNYVGPDSFSYTVADLMGAVSEATLVTLNVQGINDAPIAEMDSLTADEDQSISFNVTANDTDIDSQIVPESVSVFSGPTHGVVSISVTGEVTYTPNADYFGDDSFSYTVKDSEGAVSLPGTVSVSIASINDAPRLQDDIAQLMEDGVNDINVMGNDTDIDGGLVLASLMVTVMPEHGAVTILPGGLLRYTPDDNYYGPDRFSYSINDNDGVTSEANVQISIDSINDHPLAQDYEAVLDEDSQITLYILTNDTDLDGVLDVNSVVIMSSPASGILEVNSDGSVLYIPDANFNGSDSFSYQVSDDAGDSSETALVSLDVTPVNDAPQISGSAPETLLEGDPYQFTPTSLDIDNDTLAFTITGLPSWASFDPLTGTLSGVPAYEDVGSYGPMVISVSDGVIEVELEAFYIQVEVLDSDGDGIPDVIEIELGLDPFDATDAGQDADGDGLSNLDEWLAGSNLYVDDVAPELIIPDDIWIDATGLFTGVSIGQAQAYDYVDGVRQTCCEDLSHTMVSDLPQLKPGTHQVTWTAVDAAGNVSELVQNIFVRPLISLPQDQIVAQGNLVSVSVYLNGLSPEYPLSVAYSVAGSAVEGLHHDLTSTMVTFESGQVVATIEFTALDMEQETLQDEVVSIHLDDQLNLGSKKEHYVTITLDNLAPEIQLSSYQYEEQRTWVAKVDGAVEIQANYTDPNSLNSHTLDWSLTDSELQDVQLFEEKGVIQKISPSGVSGMKLETWLFDPSGLAEGVYTVRVTVTDDGKPNLSHFNELRIRVSELLPLLTQADSDGDGIADIEEGLGDSDGDGIPDYLDPIAAANVLPERIVNTESYLVECESGVGCRLGQYAMSGVYMGAQVAGSDIHANLQGIMPGDFVDVGGVFNIEALDLSEQNQAVNIVIPQRNSIPEHAGYRHFIHDKGWFTFETNADNQLMSAPGAAGYCPPPGSDEYSEGLNQGDWCLQLVIQDGGINDADEVVNGAVNITGCLIQEELDQPGSETVEVEILTEGGGSSSGASMQIFILSLLAVIAFFRNGPLRSRWFRNGLLKNRQLRNISHRRQVHRLSVLLTIILLSLTAQVKADVAPQVMSEDVSLTGFFISGLFARAQSSDNTGDINQSLVDAGLNAQVIELDESTSGWKLGAGYAFTPSWSVALEYIDLGEVSVRIKGVTDDPETFYATASQFYPDSVKGLGLNLGYRYQFIADVSALLHLGLFHWQADYTSYDIDSLQVVTSEDDGYSVYGGLGVEYALTKNIRFSVQWSHFSLDEQSRDLIGVGVQYLF